MCCILAVFFPVQGLVPDLDPGDGIGPVPVTVDHTDTHEGAVADDLYYGFHFLIFLSRPHPLDMLTYSSGKIHSVATY